MASNSTTIQDRNGDYPDWLEQAMFNFIDAILIGSIKAISTEVMGTLTVFKY